MHSKNFKWYFTLLSRTPFVDSHLQAKILSNIHAKILAIVKNRQPHTAAGLVDNPLKVPIDFYSLASLPAKILEKAVLYGKIAPGPAAVTDYIVFDLTITDCEQLW